SGWALQQAFEDQIAVLDVFAARVGKPTRTIAWGHSLGGMITAGLVQLHPERFSGALPMCGVVAGGPGVWNQGLDSEFALTTLQAPFKMVNFTSFGDAANNFNLASAALAAAQKNPEGRARIALSAALADVPGWFKPGSAEPAANDFAAQEVNQLAWDNNPDFLFAFFGRAELEARAGGNFSWNTGVDGVTDENAYASVVRSAGDNSMLRQVFVHRAGHCSFMPAETITAFKTLVHRLDTGGWQDGTDPGAMNATAAAFGAGPPFNILPPSFINFHPDKFLRPFDARATEG